MSLLNSIKRSFGFGEDSDDSLLQDSVETLPEAPVTPAGTLQPDKTANADEATTTDSSQLERIFDHAVAVFNAALPDFLSRSVDPEAQRKLLYDSLDQSLKDYLQSVSAATRRQCEARMAEEYSAMRAEMETLKARTKEVEQQRFDIKQQQLSADRQRRALTERLHDLEAQAASFEAEREQFDIENKSLVNKLKVASLHQEEAEALRAELNDAKAQMLKLRNESISPADSEELTQAKERIAALEAENAALSTALDEAAEKDRISTEMMNGLQSKASAARSEIETRDERIAQLEAKLAEAEQLQNDIKTINNQLSLVEDAIGRRDRKIAKLKAKIAELEANAITPIPAETLAPTEVTEPEPQPDGNDTPKISDCDLAAIEESFDTADWMQSEPTETPSMRTGVSEAEFGYQPPVRKPTHNDNDAQLSLF